MGAFLCLLRSSRSFIRGLVCVSGGLFAIIRMSFFCVRISGLMYSLFGLSVPQMAMEPMR